MKTLRFALLWCLTEAAYRATDHRFDDEARRVRRLADEVTTAGLLVPDRFGNPTGDYSGEVHS